jgi:hypothetical protein
MTETFNLPKGARVVLEYNTRAMTYTIKLFKRDQLVKTAWSDNQLGARGAVRQFSNEATK